MVISSPGNGSTRARLLLCDDSPVERLAMAHLLRGQGYQVDEAGDGASALEILKNRGIDLLLLDLEMPDVDGFDVLNYVQAHRRALPVILLTGMPPNDIQKRMAHLHSHELPAMFVKPVDPRQLVSFVELQLTGPLSQRPDSSDGQGA